ncbi:hypothetical protein 015DV002_214 [Bacillus phage 015DV002]|nr:hypothetical protein 015DV002_214 [Bacillus phage 015DV002]
MDNNRVLCDVCSGVCVSKYSRIPTEVTLAKTCVKLDFNVCNKCTDKIDNRLEEEYKGTRGMEFLKEMTGLYIEGGLPVSNLTEGD